MPRVSLDEIYKKCLSPQSTAIQKRKKVKQRLRNKQLNEVQQHLSDKLLSQRRLLHWVRVDIMSKRGELEQLHKRRLRLEERYGMSTLLFRSSFSSEFSSFALPNLRSRNSMYSTRQSFSTQQPSDTRFLPSNQNRRLIHRPTTSNCQPEWNRNTVHLSTTSDPLRDLREQLHSISQRLGEEQKNLQEIERQLEQEKVRCKELQFCGNRSEGMIQEKTRNALGLNRRRFDCNSSWWKATIITLSTSDK